MANYLKMFYCEIIYYNAYLGEIGWAAILVKLHVSMKKVIIIKPAISISWIIWLSTIYRIEKTTYLIQMLWPLCEPIPPIEALGRQDAEILLADEALDLKF